jgi:hypothetical protein
MEMLMFSGLEAQGEMNRLLDEIYGGPDQASLDQAARCSRTAETDRRQEDSALCTSPPEIGSRPPCSRGTKVRSQDTGEIRDKGG